MGLVAAFLASELALALAIGLLAMTAFRTGLARVLRVHEDHGDTRSLGLVRDEGAELEERPVAEATPESLASRCLDATANPGEVLHRDPHAQCLCLRDDL